MQSLFAVRLAAHDIQSRDQFLAVFFHRHTMIFRPLGQDLLLKADVFTGHDGRPPGLLRRGDERVQVCVKLRAGDLVAKDALPFVQGIFSGDVDTVRQGQTQGRGVISLVSDQTLPRSEGQRRALRPHGCQHGVIVRLDGLDPGPQGVVVEQYLPQILFQRHGDRSNRLPRTHQQSQKQR